MYLFKQIKVLAFIRLTLLFPIALHEKVEF